MKSKTNKTLPESRKAKLPKFISPQLATTLVKEPPSGDDWLHELKFDGYRMLCRIDHGKVSFWSCNGQDWTSKFPSVAEAMKSLPINTRVNTELKALYRSSQIPPTAPRAIEIG